jgi:hypothetical protein
MKNIDARKLAVLIDLANEADGIPTDKALPLLIKANAKMKALGLSFSQNETDLLIEILTKDMSEADKKKVEMIKKLVAKNK